MRKAHEEAPEFCHDMEMNIATKLRMEGQTNVTTFDNYVATKNRANGKKNFVTMFKTVSRQIKREINKDTLKQCRDIETDCHDIENCRRKKFYRNTSKLSRDRSWQIMKASHD